MNLYLHIKSISLKAVTHMVLVAFLMTGILPPAYAQQVTRGLDLPPAGAMLGLTQAYVPVVIKGIAVQPEDPLELSFIVDNGNSRLEGAALEAESLKLVRYFLAALTVPEKDMWVNLSPYEEDRMIPSSFGGTEMGRDLLAEDYILKQLTSSLMYPENGLGRKFWDSIYKQAAEMYGTIDIPVDTFHKVWIMPGTAVVYEHADKVLLVESRMKVMLAQDYEAMMQATGRSSQGKAQAEAEAQDGFKDSVAGIIRSVIVPAIEEEVNEGQNFIKLRQIYNAMVLAAWYKKKMGASLLGQIYVDKNKTAGVDTTDKQDNRRIFDRYVQAFRQGVYDYIKEEQDPVTREVIPRKYFSGGFTGSSLTPALEVLSSSEVAPVDKLKKIQAAAQGVGKNTNIRVRLNKATAAGHKNSADTARGKRAGLAFGKVITGILLMLALVTGRPSQSTAQDTVRAQTEVTAQARSVVGSVTITRADYSKGLKKFASYPDAVVRKIEADMARVFSNTRVLSVNLLVTIEKGSPVVAVTPGKVFPAGGQDEEDAVPELPFTARISPDLKALLGLDPVNFVPGMITLFDGAVTREQVAEKMQAAQRQKPGIFREYLSPGNQAKLAVVAQRIKDMTARAEAQEVVVTGRTDAMPPPYTQLDINVPSEKALKAALGAETLRRAGAKGKGFGPLRLSVDLQEEADALTEIYRDNLNYVIGMGRALAAAEFLGGQGVNIPVTLVSAGHQGAGGSAVSDVVALPGDRELGVQVRVASASREIAQDTAATPGAGQYKATVTPERLRTAMMRGFLGLRVGVDQMDVYRFTSGDPQMRKIIAELQARKLSLIGGNSGLVQGDSSRAVRVYNGFKMIGNKVLTFNEQYILARIAGGVPGSDISGIGQAIRSVQDDLGFGNRLSPKMTNTGSSLQLKSSGSMVNTLNAGAAMVLRVPSKEGSEPVRITFAAQKAASVFAGAGYQFDIAVDGEMSPDARALVSNVLANVAGLPGAFGANNVGENIADGYNGQAGSYIFNNARVAANGRLDAFLNASSFSRWGVKLVFPGRFDLQARYTQGSSASARLAGAISGNALIDGNFQHADAPGNTTTGYLNLAGAAKAKVDLKAGTASAKAVNFILEFKSGPLNEVLFQLGWQQSEQQLVQYSEEVSIGTGKDDPSTPWYDFTQQKPNYRNSVQGLGHAGGNDYYIDLTATPDGVWNASTARPVARHGQETTRNRLMLSMTAGDGKGGWRSKHFSANLLASAGLMELDGSFDIDVNASLQAQVNMPLNRGGTSNAGVGGNVFLNSYYSNHTFGSISGAILAINIKNFYSLLKDLTRFNNDDLTVSNIIDRYQPVLPAEERPFGLVTIKYIPGQPTFVWADLPSTPMLSFRGVWGTPVKGLQVSAGAGMDVAAQGLARAATGHVNVSIGNGQRAGENEWNLKLQYSKLNGGFSFAYLPAYGQDHARYAWGKQIKEKATAIKKISNKSLDGATLRAEPLLSVDGTEKLSPEEAEKVNVRKAVADRVGEEDWESLEVNPSWKNIVTRLGAGFYTVKYKGIGKLNQKDVAFVYVLRGNTGPRVVIFNKDSRGADAKIYKQLHKTYKHVDNSARTTEGLKDPARPDDVGGINFDSSMLDLQVRRDGNGMVLPAYMQPAEMMNIEGFSPVIINITPVTDLPGVFGLALTIPV